MKNVNNIYWYENAKGQQISNLKINENIKIDNKIYKVVSLWSSGMITLKRGTEYINIVPKYVSEIIVQNLFN